MAEMKRSVSKFVFVFAALLLSGLVFPSVVLAASGCSPIGAPGETADVPQIACLADIFVHVITVALGFLGLATVLAIIWGAIRLMLARGDQKALQAAQNTITYAIIGAVVVLGSFILVNIITSLLGLGNLLTGFTIVQ